MGSNENAPLWLGLLIPDLVSDFCGQAGSTMKGHSYAAFLT